MERADLNRTDDQLKKIARYWICIESMFVALLQSKEI